MPRYRVLRDFGSHLGNHRRGEYLSLPEVLPLGFAGFVERADDPPAPDSPPTRRGRGPAGYADKQLRAEEERR